MSDQADNLRRLVQARRLWRELAREDLPTPAHRPGTDRALLLAPACGRRHELLRKADGVLAGLLPALMAIWTRGRAGP
jgi:ferric-dicitrate binding protein FerR (iron transport regulator)